MKPFQAIAVYLAPACPLFARFSLGQIAPSPAPPAAVPQINEAVPQINEAVPQINEDLPPAFDKYSLGPDSIRQADVPVGRTFTFQLADSKIFPATVRTITVYVPAQYTGEKPACAYVALDGIGFNAPTVFDNLIAQHAMPVIIAIGVSPGLVDSLSHQDNPRFDRSLEFDSLNGRLARFILEEVLPAVESHQTPGGVVIRLSKNPDDRAIAGGSTGGIAAFTVAWERPDAFHRVFTSIGTFVGMRGGEKYYVLVRKTEPKPLRIFMEDGVHDEWGGGPEMGDWWMSNATINRALEFAGYDVRHSWGAGTHNGSHAAAIFPDAMRWLWRDWPAPITAQQSGNPVLKQILQARQGWELTADGCNAADNLAADSSGKVFFRNGSSGQLTELQSGSMPMHCAESATGGAFAFGSDGKLFVARKQGGIEVLPDGLHSGGEEVKVPELVIGNLTVRYNGDIYATTYATTASDNRNELWLIPLRGNARRLDNDLKDATGIGASPDGLWLFVAQSGSHSGISYRIQADGTLDAREPLYDFYVPDQADDSGAGQLAMDVEGRAYVATRMGVQVFDRNGRVTAILPLPHGLLLSSFHRGERDKEFTACLRVIQLLAALPQTCAAF
jgi:gluconolactonase